MDHKKIVASALGMSIVLALIILGTGNAAAVGNATNRWVSPPALAGGRGDGPTGGDPQTAKPPIQPGGSISARPNVTVSLGMWRNMRPTESMLNGVSLLPSSYTVDCGSSDRRMEGWAVGDSGVILGYCNGVWDHAIIPQYEWENLYSVQALSPTLAVAVGNRGTIEVFQYDEVQGTYLWVKLPIPTINKRLNSVSLVKRNDGSYYGWSVGESDPLVGNRGTLILGTIDPPSGSPNPISYWTNVTANPENSSLPAIWSYYAVHTLSPTNAWAVGSTVGAAGGIIIHWDGSQWSLAQTVADPLYGIKMKSASEGWAVGKQGAIYRYNGVTWSKVGSPTTQDLGSIGYAPNGEEWIFGFGGTQLKYVGGIWQQVPPENIRTDPFDFRAVDFTSGHGWLVGGHVSKGIGGQILEYDNGLWLSVTPPTDNRINAMAAVSMNDAWAVGAKDSLGGTIIHWDGKHWQRWFQRDLPIPAADLYTISMVSATDGWAAGDTLSSTGQAVLLHWDGRRWATPRTGWPVNARVNDLETFKTSDANHPVFAWGAADTGDAFAKYQTYDPDYWLSLSTCYGAWYQVFGVSMITGLNPPGNWDAWAVGKRRNNVPPHQPTNAVFMRFTPGCEVGKNAWDWFQNAPGDSYTTSLYGIKMIDVGGPWGYAAGNQGDRATIYTYYPITQTWGLYFQNPSGASNPSNFYSVDIVNSSQISWFGGFYTNQSMGGAKWAAINYVDAIGRGWVNPTYYFIPANGINVNHRPIRSIEMVSDNFGWAAGDPEDNGTSGGRSVIYQYPFPNFTLDTHPPSRAVLPTGSTTFTVTVNSVGGIGTDVSLSFPYGLPSWASASTIDPPTIDAHSIATVTIRTNNAPVGYQCIILRGSATFRSGDITTPIGRDVCLDLYITNRPVYSVTPDHGRAGTLVTITGTAFGNSRGAGDHVWWTPTNYGPLQNVQIPDSAIQSWSNTQITFLPPDNPGLFTDFPINGRVKVTAGGFDSNDNYTFKMDPWITNISTAVGASGISVTLTGTSFGNDPGPYNRATDFEHVTLNGGRIAFSNVLSWSNNTIVFTIPLSSPGGQVIVTTNGFESNTVGFGSGANKEFLPFVKK